MEQQTLQNIRVTWLTPDNYNSEYTFSRSISPEFKLYNNLQLANSEGFTMNNKTVLM